MLQSCRRSLSDTLADVGTEIFERTSEFQDDTVSLTSSVNVVDLVISVPKLKQACFDEMNEMQTLDSTVEVLTGNENTAPTLCVPFANLSTPYELNLTPTPSNTLISLGVWLNRPHE